MLVGLDFDNTIVCYDRLFHRLAVERRLVPAELAATKSAVRECLRSAGREDEWTELQGVAYGPLITEAEPYPGVVEFLARCREADVRVAIVSHKSRHPYRGPRHDLHAAAKRFLETHGFFEGGRNALSADRVFLEPTLAAKLDRIGSLGCAAFVDDLPEVLSDPGFPSGVRRVLFDPAGTRVDEHSFVRVTSWAGCANDLLGGYFA